MAARYRGIEMHPAQKSETIKRGHRTLERDLNRKLHESRSRSAFDLSEVRIFSLSIYSRGTIKLRMIEDIECLRSKLQ